MYEYRAALIDVVDGDTMHLTIDLGLDIGTRMTVRIFGVNSPEMGTPEGKVAKQWAIDWFHQHTEAIDWLATTNVTPLWPMVVHTVKDRKEKYGRYLATIVAPDGHIFNDDLLAAGMAVPYNP